MMYGLGSFGNKNDVSYFVKMKREKKVKGKRKEKDESKRKKGKA